MRGSTADTCSFVFLRTLGWILYIFYMKVDMDHVVGLVLLSPRAGAFNADNLGYSFPKTDANFSFGLKVRYVNMHVYAIERHLTRKLDVKMTDEDFSVQRMSINRVESEIVFQPLTQTPAHSQAFPSPQRTWQAATIGKPAPEPTISCKSGLEFQ